MAFSVIYNNGDDAMLQGDSLPTQPPYKPNSTTDLVDRCSMLVIDSKDGSMWYVWNTLTTSWEVTAL